MTPEFEDVFTKIMSHRLAHIHVDLQFEPFLSRSSPKWWSHIESHIVQSQPFSSRNAPWTVEETIATV
jgi:hypothetical protein